MRRKRPKDGLERLRLLLERKPFEETADPDAPIIGRDAVRAAWLRAKRDG